MGDGERRHRTSFFPKASWKGLFNCSLFYQFSTMIFFNTQKSVSERVRKIREFSLRTKVCWFVFKLLRRQRDNRWTIFGTLKLPQMLSSPTACSFQMRSKERKQGRSYSVSILCFLLSSRVLGIVPNQNLTSPSLCLR